MSTYSAVHKNESKVLQNSLTAHKIASLGPPNSKMGCYLKIGQVLADLWPIYRDRKSRIF